MRTRHNDDAGVLQQLEDLIRVSDASEQADPQEHARRRCVPLRQALQVLLCRAISNNTLERLLYKDWGLLGGHGTCNWVLYTSLMVSIGRATIS